MQQPAAYLNGEFRPYGEAAIPLHDAGFVLGATVTEQLRTFGGRVYRLDDHLQRLGRSLEIVGVELPESWEELARVAGELVEQNRRLVAGGDDLGLAIFVTPGPYATLAPAAESRPTLGMHTYDLPFRLWADKYATGQSLVTTGVPQVPAECWPSELKCRSRMHYYLADREAQRIEPGSRALLLRADGAVCETSTANLVVHREGDGLIGPPKDTVLPGVSLAALVELAAQEDIAYHERDLSVEDVQTADEALLTSTPYCLLPVVRLNGSTIGAGSPGPVFTRLLSRWSEEAGLDIAAQARQFADRR